MSASKNPVPVNAVLKTVPIASISERLGHNPREDYGRADGSLDDLIASIRSRGILTPMLLRAAKEPGRYYVVAGHRRLAAAIACGLTQAECLCLPWRPEGEIVAEDEALAIIENVQRKNLTPIEQARGYKRLLDIGIKLDQVAQMVGLKPCTVRSALRFLELPLPIQEQVAAREILRESASQLVRMQRGGVPEQEVARVAKIAATPGVHGQVVVAESSRAIVVARAQKPPQAGRRRDLAVSPAQEKNLLFDWAVKRYGSLENALKRLKEIEEAHLSRRAL